MTADADAVTLHQRATPSDQVLVQEVGGELVLLDMAGEHYFGLDPVGARIWALLGEDGDLAGVLARLCEEYDADPARIEADLLALVGELRAAGLVNLG